MADIGAFISWMLILCFIVGAAVGCIALFVRKDSMKYDREFTWSHLDYDPGESEANSSYRSDDKSQSKNVT